MTYLADTDLGERRASEARTPVQDVLAGQQAKQGVRSEDAARAPLQSAACT